MPAPNALAEAPRVADLAREVAVQPDFAPVAARIQAEATDTWADQVAVDRFVGKRWPVRARSRASGRPRTVAVDTPDGDRLEFTARRAIVLNPGTDPAIPPIPGGRPHRGPGPQPTCDRADRHRGGAKFGTRLDSPGR